MKKTRVTIDPDNKPEHEPTFHVRKGTKYEPYGLRALRGGKFSTKKVGFASKKAPVFSQRVTVKARVVKMKATKGVKNLRAHIGYLERSGTAIDGKEPKFFTSNPAITPESLRSVISNWEGDLHHFRFIISPENGTELSLKDLVNKVMEGVKKEVNSEIEWFSVCHYNTDNPHAHVVLRGVKDDGSALILTKEFISKGIRDIASREATISLGSRDIGDIKQSIERVTRERKLTFLDKEIFAKGEGIGKRNVTISPLNECRNEFERGRRNAYLARLGFLTELGLAEKLTDRDYELKEGIEEFLSKLGQIENVRKQIHNSLPEAKIPNDIVVYGRGNHLEQEITGKVLGRVLRDELTDSLALYVSGIDGKHHFIPISDFSETEGFRAREQDIVSIKSANMRVADKVLYQFGDKQTIDKAAPLKISFNLLSQTIMLAHKNNRWKIPVELSEDEYLERFRTRLISLEESGIAQKKDKDTWVLPRDFISKVNDLEKSLGGSFRVKVDIKSSVSLIEQANSEAPTWLDEVIIKNTELKAGFGKEVIDAIKIRKEFLHSRGILTDSPYANKLYSESLDRVCTQLSTAHSSCRLAKSGEEILGKFKGYVRIGDIDHVLIVANNHLVLGARGVRSPRLKEGGYYKFKFIGEAKNFLHRGFFRADKILGKSKEKTSREFQR